MLSDLTHELIGSPLILAVALLAVFLDALVPVMPSGTLVLAASLWATTQEVGLLAVAVPVAAASVLGDLLVVTLARSRPLRRPALTSAAARMGKALTGRLGRTTVAARFVPGGRTVLAVAVGTTGCHGVAICSGRWWEGYCGPAISPAWDGSTASGSMLPGWVSPSRSRPRSSWARAWHARCQ